MLQYIFYLILREGDSEILNVFVTDGFFILFLGSTCEVATSELQ